MKMHEIATLCKFLVITGWGGLRGGQPLDLMDRHLKMKQKMKSDTKLTNLRANLRSISRARISEMIFELKKD